MAKFCGHCGQPTDGARFCTSCGQPVPSGNTAGPPANPPASPAPPSVPNESPRPPAPEEPTPQQPGQQSESALEQEEHQRTTDVAPTNEPPAYEPPAYEMPTYEEPRPARPETQQPFGSPPPAPPGHPQQPWAGTPGSPRTMGNPLAGVPVADYLRDVGAVLLLFFSLALPWDFSGDAAERWWVVVSILLCLAALTAPYVAATRAVPGFGPFQSQLVKLLLALPLLGSTLAAVVNELINAASTDGLSGIFVDGSVRGGGVGAAVGVALAGAALAVQPRRSEEPRDHRDDRYWRSATAVAGVAALVITGAVAVASLIWFLDDSGGLTGLFVLYLLALVVGTAGLVALVAGVPLVGALRGSVPAARVLAVVTLTVAGVSIIGTAGDEPNGSFLMPPVETWNGFLGGTFLLLLAGSLAVSRPVQRLDEHYQAWAWITAAGHALVIAAIGVAAEAGIVLALLVAAEVDPGEWVTAVVGCLLGLVGAGVMLAARARLGVLTQSRPTVVGLLAGVVVVDAVAVALILTNDALTLYSSFALNGYEVGIWLTLPAFAAACLVAPSSVRRALGPLVPERAGWAYDQTPGGDRQYGDPGGRQYDDPRGQR